MPEQSRAYCTGCKKPTLHALEPDLNHVVHILASVFLCGWWLPVWGYLSSVHKRESRCATCGLSDPNGTVTGSPYAMPLLIGGVIWVMICAAPIMVTLLVVAGLIINGK